MEADSIFLMNKTYTSIDGTKMKAVLCGTGWRARFYIRIAAALPSFLGLSSIYTHSEERKVQLIKDGLNAVTDLAEALSFEHDAVIVASGREGFLPLIEHLDEKGEKIITETSFLTLSDTELERAAEVIGWTLEQYLHTPFYSSVMKAAEKVGRISYVYLSGLHNHHAASIMRALFPGKEIKEVRRLLESSAECLKTGDRSGMIRSGEMEEYKRKMTAVTFTSGEVFICDFSSNQYHSYIIPPRIEIRGERGVVTERGVTYIDGEGYPVSEEFVFHRENGKCGHYPSLSHVTLGSATVFRNVFYPSLLSDDEIAIAHMLLEYMEGRAIYTIKEAATDAAVGKLF